MQLPAFLALTLSLFVSSSVSVSVCLFLSYELWMILLATLNNLIDMKSLASSVTNPKRGPTKEYEGGKMTGMIPNGILASGHDNSFISAFHRDALNLRSITNSPEMRNGLPVPWDISISPIHVFQTMIRRWQNFIIFLRIWNGTNMRSFHSKCSDCFTPI